MQEGESEELARIARQVAGHIAAGLEQRLAAFHGHGWLSAVNERRVAEGKPPIKALSDHRSCLAVFGYDPATVGWANEDLRRMARELVGLANKAHHDERLTHSDLMRAQSILHVFLESFSPETTVREEIGEDTRETGYPYGSDVHVPVRLTVGEAKVGIVKKISLRDPMSPWTKTLKVRFPPNLMDMQELRIKGQGIPGRNGAQSGDAWITIFIVSS